MKIRNSNKPGYTKVIGVAGNPKKIYYRKMRKGERKSKYKPGEVEDVEEKSPDVLTEEVKLIAPIIPPMPENMFPVLEPKKEIIRPVHQSRVTVVAVNDIKQLEGSMNVNIEHWNSKGWEMMSVNVKHVLANYASFMIATIHFKKFNQVKF